MEKAHLISDRLQQWVKLFGTTAGDGGFGLAVDAFGNAYVTGGTWGDLDGQTNAGSEDIFIAKIAPDGTWW